MKYTVVLGGFFYSLLFILAALGHFSKQTIEYAASQGVPFASLAVPFSGLMAFAGGLSILFGYRTRWGAWLIVLFLIPVTLMMHPFWKVTDLTMHQMQMTMFMKNVALLGGGLAFAYFGAGPVSVDDARKLMLTH